jgi:hypothetical protein
MARKKTEVPVCLHPMEQAFKEERGDGSGKWDMICGYCGTTICECAAPVEEVTPCVDPDKAECQHGAEETRAKCGDYDTATTYVCTREDCSHYGQDIEGRTCYKSGEEPTGECAAYVSGEVVINADFDEEVEKAEADLGLKSYVSREPDKISPVFLRELPVPVPEEELAEHAKEQARLFSVWTKTHLDKKAFTKSCNQVIEETEEKLLEIAQIVNTGTEERSVPCQWEFDYVAGEKVLRRRDTWEIVGKPVTLEGEELHLSFNFDGSSERAVEKLAEVQEGAGDTPLTDDPAEEDETPFLTDEEQAALEQIPGEAPVIEISADSPDKHRACCMPSDRGEMRDGDVIVTFCKVCGLIHKKSPVGGDPWETIDFTVGEKVDLEAVQA